MDTVAEKTGDCWAFGASNLECTAAGEMREYLPAEEAVAITRFYAAAQQ